MTYNLDENVQESFEFSLGGHTYKMMYPTAEEITAIQKVANDPSKTPEERADLQSKAMMKLIQAQDSTAPPIDKALEKISLPVLRRFNDMLKQELSIE